VTARFDIGGADRAHTWHPYTQHASAGDPIPIVRARGAYLIDDAGREILDAISSWWVTLHGHAEPAIAAAIAAQATQLEQVIFAGFTHEPAARLAHELARIAPPGLTRAFFSDDGSTAVEVAVKMALQYWANAGEPRTKIIALENAYHGDTFGAMSVSAPSVFTAAFGSLLFDVVRLGDPSSTDVAAQLDALLDGGASDVAAVIVEPMVQGAGGMRMWPAASLAHIRAATLAAGIPLIADEVLTGFGRTGPMFACNHADIAPDIMCLSKGLTGGFLPMGVTLTTDRMFERFASSNRAHTFFHGHSYTANPLACAAALASIRLLDDACLQRRQRIEAAHRDAARGFSAHRAAQNVRVLGTILALDIEDTGGYLAPVGLDARAFALARGVLLRPLGNTMYVLPPYCVTSGDLQRVYTVIGDFLDTR
jgi:adenosylmethionine-8-amino-7-oxononanoate aminotransferase